MLAVEIALLVFFCIRVLFRHSPNAVSIDSLSEPGFEELTVEPLYYAFNDDSDFDSSVNGQFSESCSQAWTADLKSRRKRIVIYICLVMLLLVASCFVPKPFHNHAQENEVQQMQ